jgi:phosphoglucosamine mutase
MDALPPYSLERIKIGADRTTFRKALRLIQREHPDAIVIDGVRVNGRFGWILFRPSRTEDVVRISVEARTAEDLRAAMGEARSMLSRAMDSGGGIA